ncbi:Tryptophan synthase alpha chain [Devosia equisanguinis]|uniref:tryptophan synthase n=1 Tax=Devosia equisanguinis TaxID=2490941 RepID=A0A447IDA8_9HYPH|nr:tryptophan synthase subunit alpha [Devosia equisanguinis]VDS05445.1 Tryptophan synthase alpha chain [Devosia equisanguinis]
MPLHSAKIKALSAQNPALLSCYFPLGDPAVPLDMVDIYAGEGVDVLEIGMASPNPYLDGSDVRQSMARANRDHARANLDALLDRLARLPQAPATLLMTYADGEHPGLAGPQFWSGLDSLLVVAPEADPLRQRLEANAIAAGLKPSSFVALPMTEAAIAAAQQASFYVMLQAAAGVTGPRDVVDPANADHIATLRQAGVTVPILPGFGISRGEHARTVRSLGGDGVIVGSETLRAALAGPDALRRLFRDLRGGLDG